MMIALFITPLIQDFQNLVIDNGPIPNIDCPYREPDSCAGTSSPAAACCPTGATKVTEEVTEGVTEVTEGVTEVTEGVTEGAMAATSAAAVLFATLAGTLAILIL